MNRTILAVTATDQYLERGNYKPEVLYPNPTEDSASTEIVENTQVHESLPIHNNLSSHLGISRKRQTRTFFSSDLRQQLHYSKEEFFIDIVPYPYIPPALKSLLEKKSLTKNQKVILMTSLAKQAINHFQPYYGAYLAINLAGQILSVSKSKIDLLKKIQSIPLSESVFLWRVGSDSFSGWF